MENEKKLTALQKFVLKWMRDEACHLLAVSVKARWEQGKPGGYIDSRVAVPAKLRDAFQLADEEVGRKQKEETDDLPGDLEINRELVLSTGHTSWRDHKLLKRTQVLPVYPYEFGLRVYTLEPCPGPDEQEENMRKEGFSPYMWQLVQKVRALGCKWLVLDCDGPVCEGFRLFDWEAEQKEEIKSLHAFIYCDGCEPVVVNGVPCHETECKRGNKDWVLMNHVLAPYSSVVPPRLREMFAEGKEEEEEDDA